jgi:glutamate---cysteine ligase / carboxylate-amine ligase
VTAPHPPLSVGVEEEFHLVDAGTGELAPAADRVLRRLDGSVFDHELQRSTVETQTEPHEQLSAVREDLEARRRDLVAAAADESLLLLASGTAPRSDWRRPEVTEDDRYDRMVREHGIVAEQQVVCGCHVHVGVDDQATAVRAMGHVRPWLATLLALSASSPYWQGEDTGHASFRTQVWNRWPTAGPPPALADEAEFEQRVAELLRTGAIIDRKQLYWFVRPSDALPTIEFRVADVCTDPSEAALQAALCRGLVATALTREAAGVPPPEVHHVLLDVATWRAARSGIGDALVDPVHGDARPARELVDALVADVAPALDAHGDLAWVEAEVARTFERGTGADRQRRAVAERGDLDDAVALVARENDPAGT